MARLSKGIFCPLFLLMQLMLAFPIDTTHGLIKDKEAAGNASRSHDCGVTAFASPALNLTSPGFPDHLLHDFYLCEWILQGLYNHQVKVTFPTFDLPHADHEGNCYAAFINYGGYDYQGRRVVEGKRCGADTPEPFYALTRGAWVELVLTGAAHPSVYKKCKGLLIHYQLEKTGMLENEIFIIVVLSVMLPAICCCPIVCFFRNKKQNKDMAYLNHMRAEARRHKQEMKDYLARRGEWAVKQQNDAVKVTNTEGGSSGGHLSSPCEITYTSTIHPSPHCSTSGNHGNTSQHRPSSTAHTESKATERFFESTSSPRSSYGWVKVTPIAVHSPNFGIQDIIRHRCGLQNSSRKRLRKLSLAFSAPSLGSICELDEMYPRRDLDLEPEMSDNEIKNVEDSKMSEENADEKDDEVFL